ncbi:hypothetical protein WOC76_04235 [Methylocystis sp. IM3]|uniref:hypothetical protein n=1 Tax=unclassified Methylocystis TaxID=2625913 RepID=UPI0030FB584C
MNIVAIVESPSEIAGACDLRRRELNITNLALDDAAGLQSGYSSTLFCGKKRMGDMSMPSMLGALGMKLIAVADDAWVPPVTWRCSSIAWCPISRLPILCPPSDRVFAALPAPREEPPAVIELASWERLDRPTR